MCDVQIVNLIVVWETKKHVSQECSVLAVTGRNNICLEGTGCRRDFPF